jgi:hypothetical protein
MSYAGTQKWLFEICFKRPGNKNYIPHFETECFNETIQFK